MQEADIPEIPHIHFDFVLSGKPNAYAFKNRSAMADSLPRVWRR